MLASEGEINERPCVYANRNPNEGTPDAAMLRTERTKLKNIDWIAYETVHKKYLSIGEAEIEFCRKFPVGRLVAGLLEIKMEDLSPPVRDPRGKLEKETFHLRDIAISKERGRGCRYEAVRIFRNV